jgi:hypothetical protein
MESLLDRAARLLRMATTWTKRAPFGICEHPASVIVGAYCGALGLPRVRLQVSGFATTTTSNCVNPPHG